MAPKEGGLRRGGLDDLGRGDGGEIIAGTATADDWPELLISLSIEMDIGSLGSLCSSCCTVKSSMENVGAVVSVVSF